MSQPDQVRRALTDDHEALLVEISINTFLINTGTRLILVDTGAGELFGPHSAAGLSQTFAQRDIGRTKSTPYC